MDKNKLSLLALIMGMGAMSIGGTPNKIIYSTKRKCELCNNDFDNLFTMENNISQLHPRKMKVCHTCYKTFTGVK